MQQYNTLNETEKREYIKTLFVKSVVSTISSRDLETMKQLMDIFEGSDKVIKDNVFRLNIYRLCDLLRKISRNNEFTYPLNSNLYKNLITQLSTDGEQLKYRTAYLTIFPNCEELLKDCVSRNIFSISDKRLVTNEYLVKNDILLDLTVRYIHSGGTNMYGYSDIERIALVLEYGDLKRLGPNTLETLIDKILNVEGFLGEDPWRFERALKVISQEELLKKIPTNFKLLLNPKVQETEVFKDVQSDSDYWRNYDINEISSRLYSVLKVWPQLQNDRNFVVKVIDGNIANLEYFPNFKDDEEFRELIITAFFDGTIGVIPYDED